MGTLDEVSRFLAKAEGELAEINARRTELLGHIAELQHEKALHGHEIPPQPPLFTATIQSPEKGKIRLLSINLGS